MSIVNAELGGDFLIDVNDALEAVIERYVGWMCSRATRDDLLDEAAHAVRGAICAAEGRE